MAHFAQLNEENKVTQVIVIDNSKLLVDGIEVEEQGINFCKKLFGDNTNWIQTSYNSNFRNKYAGIGDTYDNINDVFISPQPYPSWTLNNNFKWEAPTPMPTDGVYYWDEDILDWIEVSIQEEK